jgi:amino acid permease
MYPSPYRGVLELIILKVSIKKIISDLTGDDSFYSSDIFLVIVIALAELPLILVKKIEKLRFFSFVGVAGIIVFIISVVIHFLLKISDGFEGGTLRAFP